MTIDELQIQLDLNPDNQASTLNNADTYRHIDIGYLFVDDETGQCYLFDKNGQEDDINKIKNIGHRAFYDCSSLKNILIPDSVESIGDDAFNGCTSLISILIPDSVESIGDDAFNGCTSLTSISIPNSVKRIENRAFAFCLSLASIEIPNSVESIGNWGIFLLRIFNKHFNPRLS